VSAPDTLGTVPSLFKRRGELADLARRESEGEDFWTQDFDAKVRIKVQRAFNRNVPNAREAMLQARGFLLDDMGTLTLANVRNAEEDFSAFYERADTEEFTSVVEALMFGAAMAPQDVFTRPDIRGFANDINQIFAEHRVGWEWVETEMVPYRSKEMHSAVVAPTLRLLSGRSGWDAIESSYRAALDELGKGESGDAITDASRALEEALGSLGYGGRTLGQRTDAAVRAGAIRSEDRKLYEWVAAARGNLSDAHAGNEGERSEAWLVVHVVGALILRLADAS
jgi:hypothetical protein